MFSRFRLRLAFILCSSASLSACAAPVTPAAQMTIQLGGYGVAFLKLTP